MARKFSGKELEKQKEPSLETRILGDLSDAAFEAIILSENNLCIDQNRTAGIMFGYTHKNALGRQLSDWFAPDDRQMVLKKIGSHSLQQVEATALRKDKTLFPCKIQFRRTEYQGRNIGIVAIRDITEQKETEQKILSGEAYMRSVFRAAPTGIGVVKDRVFIEVNDRFCDMIQYSKGELIGQPSTIIYPSQEEYEKVGIEKYRQIQKTGTGTVETVLMCKDGKTIDVLLSSTPIDINDLSVGVTFTALDITDRKQAERAMRESREKYQSIMESMDDAAYICTPDYRIGFMNPAMEKMIGYDAVGEVCYKTIFGYKKKCRTCFFDSIRNGKVARTELTNPKNNRTYLTSNSPLKNPDGSLSMLTIFRDITDIRQMENRMVQAQKMEAIGTLAGGIAHDFNNILFPICGYAEMLLDDLSEDSPFKYSVNEIYSGAMRAKDLVKQILTFSRQETMELQLIKIQPVVKEAIKLLRSTIPATIDIQFEIDKDCGPVKSNPTQIHQIVMNLATNAYHAMEDDGGTMTVRLKNVQIDPANRIDPEMEPGRYVCLTVSDSGMGMTQEIIEKIFEPYFTTKKKNKGTGMGLSVVHGIVTGMGGIIDVDSRPEKGTAFNLYFPSEQQISTERKIQDLPSILGGNEHVLLVDDEISILAVEKQFLEKLGYRVSCRSSSIEALEAFQGAPYKYDIVISDVAMPNLRGDKLAAKMMEIRLDIPILLCTGFSESVTEETAKKIGIRGVIMKPVITRELAAAVRDILDRSKE